MPLNWRVWPLLPVALLLTVSGIVPQTIAAQLSRPDFNEDLDFDSGSQAFPDSHWDICLNRRQIRGIINGRLGYQVSLEGSPNLDAPGFDWIDSRSLEDPYPQLFNLGEHIVQTDDSSMQALVALPTASAPSQVVHELLEDSKSPVVPDAVSPGACLFPRICGCLGCMARSVRWAMTPACTQVSVTSFPISVLL